MTATVKTALRFNWDEPEGCTTPRGWCAIIEADHPDHDKYAWDYCRDHCGGLVCGNYLTYPVTRGPNGETVHAVAYFHHCTSNGTASVIHLGFSWFFTTEEAKDFIEGNICAYFGIARPNNHHTEPVEPIA